MHHLNPKPWHVHVCMVQLSSTSHHWTDYMHDMHGNAQIACSLKDIACLHAGVGMAASKHSVLTAVQHNSRTPYAHAHEHEQNIEAHAVTGACYPISTLILSDLQRSAGACIPVLVTSPLACRLAW